MPLHPSYLPMLVPGGGGSSGGGGLTVTGACLATLEVGQFVYPSGVSLSGQRMFGVCDPMNMATMPSVGLVVSKPTPTTCVVALAGLVGIPASLGLPAASRAWVGLDGFPTTIFLTVTYDDVYVQSVGTTGKSTELFLNLGEVIGLV